MNWIEFSKDPKQIFKRIKKNSNILKSNFTEKRIKTTEDSDSVLKWEIPSENLTEQFEISFSYLSEFLEHCNDFRSFKFEKLLGRGGFGEVWRVLNTRTRRRLAAKVVAIRSKVKPKLLKKLIQIEKDIMTVNQHPFICRCEFAFRSEHRYYLFMEYCPYRDLGFLSRKVLHGFKERVVRLFLAEIVLAIGFLHSLNIMHRDIKTENILMDSSGHIKLTGKFSFILNYFLK